MNCISCTLWTDKSSSQGISLSTRIDSFCTGEAHSLLVQLLLCIVILSLNPFLFTPSILPQSSVLDLPTARLRPHVYKGSKNVFHKNKSRCRDGAKCQRTHVPA